MSAPLNSQRVASEPFGQIGVRQYLFPVLTCCFLTLTVLSIGMWLRSHYLVDRLFCERGGTTWYFTSIYGRVLVAWGNGTPIPSAGSEWTYSQEPMPDSISDDWNDSVLKRIGIEWRTSPIKPRWGTTGGWVRIRWPFIVAVAALLPLARLVREHRRPRAVGRARR